MKSCALWLGASALAIAFSGTAIAQTAPAETQTNADAASDTEGEIIVTANRRNENLMTTGISASVLSGDDLANKGVVNVDALQFAMPSVVVNNFGQGNNFNVRGIGKAEHNTQTTTGVITYRDGVPSFPGYFQLEPYYDVASIQVLRGPQGTIIGQNATGGAVLADTNDPVIGGGWHGYVNANYGNYNEFGAQGALNIPLTDNFAARIALFGSARDSFYNIDDGAGGDYPYNKGDVRMVAGRISFLWKPTDSLSILSKSDFDYLDMGAYPAGSIANRGNRDLFDISLNAPQSARDKFLRTILKIENVFPSGIKFRSVSGFQTGNTQYEADTDGSAAAVPSFYFYDTVTETQFSQEFNLISPDNQRFTWQVGAFGLWNTYFFLPDYKFTTNYAYPFELPLYTYQLQGRNPTRSLAVFGQVGFEITPSVKIDVGGRYTASQSTNHVDILYPSFLAPPFGQTYLRTDQQVKSDNFSYKVTLGWKVNDDQYLYGFVATGFRPGGLNVPFEAAIPEPFDPEEVTSYELGWKGNFAGGRLRTTVTGFYNAYKNFQVIVGIPERPRFGIELNVPDTTKIYGAEAEFEYKDGGLSLGAGISVLHSELGAFFAADTRATTGLPVAPCDPNVGNPANPYCIDLTGRQQTYAPNVTFNAAASYEFQLGGGDTLTPRINYGHVGKQWATLFEDAARGDRVGSRSIVNAQLAYSTDSWTITAFATNLLDKHYIAAVAGLDFAGPPRQYGLKVLKTF